MKEHMEFLYSPLPIARYRLVGLENDEVSVILHSGIPGPLWNLFWLTNPDLDQVPSAGDRWWKVYSPNRGYLPALIHDAYNNSTLACKVTEHPMSFCLWFETQEHRDYHTYEAAGGRVWVDTVLRRTSEATDRLLVNRPPVRFEAGRVKLLSPE